MKAMQGEEQTFFENETRRKIFECRNCRKCLKIVEIVENEKKSRKVLDKKFLYFKILSSS